MSALTLEEGVAYQNAIQIQADILAYFKPGGAFAVAAYAIAGLVLVWIVIGVALKNEWQRLLWLVWIAMAWALFIPASYSTGQQKASWVYEQLDKLADGMTTGILRVIDAVTHTGFFDPATGFMEAGAFPLRSVAERIFYARVPAALDEKIHHFSAGSPAPCLTKEMVESAGLTQTALTKRHVDLPGTTGQTTKNCWDYLTEIQQDINAYAQGKYGYEVRTTVRRALLAGNSPKIPEPIDSPIWQEKVRERLEDTSRQALGDLQGFILSATAVFIPFVVLVVFVPKIGWWGLLYYSGVILAARLTGGFYYVVHVLFDKPAFTNLVDPDTNVTLNHILEIRMRAYNAAEQGFFTTVDYALKRDDFFLAACPIVAFALVFGILLAPRIRNRG